MKKIKSITLNGKMYVGGSGYVVSLHDFAKSSINRSNSDYFATNQNWMTEINGVRFDGGMAVIGASPIKGILRTIVGNVFTNDMLIAKRETPTAAQLFEIMKGGVVIRKGGSNSDIVATARLKNPVIDLFGSVEPVTAKGCATFNQGRPSQTFHLGLKSHVRVGENNEVINENLERRKELERKLKVTSDKTDKKEIEEQINHLRDQENSFSLSHLNGEHIYSIPSFDLNNPDNSPYFVTSIELNPTTNGEFNTMSAGLLLKVLRSIRADDDFATDLAKCIGSDFTKFVIGSHQTVGYGAIYTSYSVSVRFADGTNQNIENIFEENDLLSDLIKSYEDNIKNMSFDVSTQKAMNVSETETI